MKLIYESTSCLIHLLLLTELFVRSSSFPTHSPSLCLPFGSMLHQLERLLNSSKKIHNLTDEELLHLAAADCKLEGLPDIKHTAAHFRFLKVNESLLQLYEHTESFRLHVDWLKEAKENVSLPFQAEEGASLHLLQLSDLIRKSLHKINEEVPKIPTPLPPDVSNAFDALRFSIQISEKLKLFCIWSKRILWHFSRESGCPRH